MKKWINLDRKGYIMENEPVLQNYPDWAAKGHLLNIFSSWGETFYIMTVIIELKTSEKMEWESRTISFQIGFISLKYI